MLCSGFGLSSLVFTCFNIEKSIISQVNLVLASQEIVEVELHDIEECHLFALQISESRRLLTVVVIYSPSKFTSDGCWTVLLTVGRQRTRRSITFCFIKISFATPFKLTCYLLAYHSNMVSKLGMFLK